MNRFGPGSPIALAVVLVCLTGITSARADDGSSGVSLAGLRSQPSVSLRANVAALTLDGDSVALRIEIQATPAARALRLRGPLFTWLGAGESYPDRHFPELSAALDPGPSDAAESFEAFAGGRDITAALTALQLDPFVVATTPPLIAAPTDRAADLAAYQRLVALRAVQLRDGQPWAFWQARRVWRFTWPPTASVQPQRFTQTFTLKYTARPGLRLLDAQQPARALSLASYCLSAAQWRAWLAAAELTGMPLVARTYAIALGVDGRPPARSTVQVDDAQAVFCSAEGRAAFGGPTPAEARTDKAGVLHVLRMAKPG